MLAFRYDTQLLMEHSTLDEETLAALILREVPGDSLLAVGDAELMKVHFHTNAPWKLLELCAGVGEMYDIIVEDMDRQSRGLQG